MARAVFTAEEGIGGISTRAKLPGLNDGNKATIESVKFIQQVIVTTGLALGASPRIALALTVNEDYFPSIDERSCVAIATFKPIVAVGAGPYDAFYAEAQEGAVGQLSVIDNRPLTIWGERSADVGAGSTIFLVAVTYTLSTISQVERAQIAAYLM